MIYHIAAGADWERARRTGHYEAPSQRQEGFLHAAERHQVLRVARAFFAGRTDLVLLAIDPAALDHATRVVHEAPPGGTETYPHVYGPVPLGAVVAAHPFRPDSDLPFSLR